MLSALKVWLDTSDPVRPLLLAIFGWVAEQERTRLIQRTKAGLERARQEGRRLGRPRVSLKVAAAVQRVHAGVVSGLVMAYRNVAVLSVGTQSLS